MTHVASNALVSLGYEGRTVDELIAQLLEEHVRVLVDVRMTPLSRKPGMSKRKLSAALDEVGIRYVHLRALGNPKDNRAPFRAGDPASRAAFRRLLGRGEGAAAMQQVTELASGEVVALLCFEREQAACHRHVVIDELCQSNPGLELIEV